jgi:hypothetical protein
MSLRQGDKAARGCSSQLRARSQGHVLPCPARHIRLIDRVQQHLLHSTLRGHPRAMIGSCYCSIDEPPITPHRGVR